MDKSISSIPTTPNIPNSVNSVVYGIVNHPSVELLIWKDFKNGNHCIVIVFCVVIAGRYNHTILLNWILRPCQLCMSVLENQGVPRYDQFCHSADTYRSTKASHSCKDTVNVSLLS